MNNNDLLKHARKFVFNAIPEHVHEIDKYDECSYFDVYVEWRSKDKWAVLDRYGACYNRNGEREHEPQPSSRDENFLENYRFSLEEAVKIAEQVSYKIKVNRFTVEEFIEFVLKRANNEQEQ